VVLTVIIIGFGSGAEWKYGIRNDRWVRGLDYRPGVCPNASIKLSDAHRHNWRTQLICTTNLVN
jgi:hypothetical protein